MQTINSEKSLREAILELQEKRADEERILREQFHLAYESMKPINLIKNTFKEVVASKDLKDDLINTSIGLTVGYLSKRIFEGATNNPAKKILGTALMFGIKNIVAKNPETVKKLVHGLFKIIRSKFNKDHETDNNKTN